MAVKTIAVLLVALAAAPLPSAVVSTMAASASAADRARPPRTWKAPTYSYLGLVLR